MPLRTHRLAYPYGSEKMVRAVIHSCCFHEVICGLLPAQGWAGWGLAQWDRIAGPPLFLCLAGRQEVGRQEGRKVGYLSLPPSNYLER